MKRWRARSTAPKNTKILVRYMNKWRGDDFRETFEAMFDGGTFWRTGCIKKDYDKHPSVFRTRVLDGDFQRAVYENQGRTSAIIGWMKLPVVGVL